MIALRAALPTKWSRARTHAVAVPAIVLTTAAAAAQVMVKRSALNDSRWLTAFHHTPRPWSRAWVARAATGLRTIRLR